MTIKQLSVFLENKPGALSRPCRLLADAGINLQTFALADAREFGILRLVVHEWERAAKLLTENGMVVKTTDLVAIEVPDRPGGLAGVLEILERAKLNVEYMYAFTDKQDGRGLLAFRFADPQAAVQALQAGNINVFGTLDLSRRLAN